MLEFSFFAQMKVWQIVELEVIQGIVTQLQIAISGIKGRASVPPSLVQRKGTSICYDYQAHTWSMVSLRPWSTRKQVEA